MPMCTPNKYSRRLKRLRLGMPPCIPFTINNYNFVLRSITSCVMCYAWSVSLFTFQFYLALLAVHRKLEPYFLCVGEKHTPLYRRTHHRIFMLIFAMCVI